MRQPLFALSLLLSLFAAGPIACRFAADRTPPSTPVPAPPTLEEARVFYASQPPYLRPRPYTPTPAGLADLSAATCGTCHQEIYAEWQLSTHAQAWLGDPQFQAEMHKGDPAQSDVRWMCINCHTPMENQLERLVGRLEDGRLDKPIYGPNPNFDARLQLEAITCATCHVRDGVVLGPFGDTQAPHPVRKDATLRSAALCSSCHNAQASFPQINLACVFTTGTEHAASPQGQAGQICQDCHMPEVERPLMAGFPPRKTRRHWFGGSLIPKRPELAAGLEPLKAHYPDGLTARWHSLPDQLRAGGEALTLRLEYQNERAGHMLPTGDPERFILVRGEALGPDGALLGEVETRIGSTYVWYPEVKLEQDNRLKPGELRTLELKFTPPARGPVTLKLVASKWRISDENLRFHHLEGRYPPGRTFIDETVLLPVR